MPHTNSTLLQEIEELAKFPEMNPGPVIRLDGDGNVLLANSGARSIFGKQSLVGMCWLDLCPGLTQDKWQEIKKSRKSFGVEADVDEQCYLFTHVSPENSENHFVFGSNVSQIKIIERELLEQKKSLANMARFPDMNPGPVLRLEMDGCIVLTNKAAQGVFGRDLKGENWKDKCPGMTPEQWGKIHTSNSITRLEVALNSKVYMFTHNPDPESGFIFVFGADITEHKETERSLQQSEKMATLGTLAAGVAHELNNPAAATKRASEILRGKLSELEKAHIMLNQLSLSDDDKELVVSLERRAVDNSSDPNTMDALSRSDLEMDIEDWLDDQGYDNEADMGPSLIGLGVTIEELNGLVDKHQTDKLEAILHWSSIIFPVYSLLVEISEGTSRISEIVVALKNYSFLGQAQILDIDLHHGIDNTLVILRSKMKKGVQVEREYDENVPHIMAYGSELNQVWTNILDNAVDAMNGEGIIKIRTKALGDEVQVEIEDNGSGMPPDVAGKIFDPFFTTKTIGKGTGLGLSTSYGIITQKQQGTISVTSEPGKTIFKITLPINLKTND